MIGEVVVAHYREDLSWLEWLNKLKLGERPHCLEVGEDVEGNPLKITVYHKGEDRQPPGCALSDVGREAHTYLHHIYKHYDDLADVTLLTQGDPTPHIKGMFKKNVLRMLLSHGAMGMVATPFVEFCREWDEEGRLTCTPAWEKKTGEYVARSSIPFARWWESRLGFPPPRFGVFYHIGAIFAVPRQAILRHPQSFYRTLLNDVSGHVNPEETYYLERAWLYIFGWPMIVAKE